MARRHLGKRGSKDVAQERIDRLFTLAEEEASGGKDDRASRYVSLALRMGERHKVPARHKRTYCPSCHTFFIPPRTVRVRTGRGQVSMTCLKCGHIVRYPMRRTRGA